MVIWGIIDNLQRLDLGRERCRHGHDADDALYRGELAQLSEDQSERVAKEFFARGRGTLAFFTTEPTENY